MSDPFDTIREALGYAFSAAESRDIGWGFPEPLIETKGQKADALAALDELREQLRQADELRAWVDAGPTMRLRTIEQVVAAQAHADRAEQENRRLREALEYIGDETHPLPPTAEGMQKRARAALAAAEEPR